MFEHTLDPLAKLALIHAISTNVEHGFAEFPGLHTITVHALAPQHIFFSAAVLHLHETSLPIPKIDEMVIGCDFYVVMGRQLESLFDLFGGGQIIPA